MGDASEYVYGMGKRRHIPDEVIDEDHSGRNVYTLCDHVYGYRTLDAYMEDLEEYMSLEEVNREVIRVTNFPICGTCRRVEESRVQPS